MSQSDVTVGAEYVVWNNTWLRDGSASFAVPMGDVVVVEAADAVSDSIRVRHHRSGLVGTVSSVKFAIDYRELGSRHRAASTEVKPLTSTNGSEADCG